MRETRQQLPISVPEPLNWPRLVLLVFFFASPWMYRVTFLPFQLSQLLGAGVIVAAAATILMRGRVVTTTFHHWLTAWVAWSAASVLWSSDAGYAIPGLLGLLKCYALAMATQQIADRPDDYRGLVQAFLLGTLLSTAYTLMSYTFFAASAENLLQLRRWRYSGGEYDSNTFAVVMAATLSLAVWLSVRTRHAVLKWTYLALLPIGWYAILLSASRTGVVCAVFATGLLLATRFPGKANLVISAALIVMLGIASGFVEVPDVAAKRLLGTADEIAKGDWSGRLEIWKAGLTVFVQNVVNGIGWGNFELAMVPYFYREFAAHNALLNVAVETGIIGVALFVGWFWALAVQALAAARSAGFAPLIALATLSLGLTTLSFGSQQLIWVILILCAGLTSRSRAPNIEGLGQQGRLHVGVTPQHRY
jgi:O-antigen ligase